MSVFDDDHDVLSLYSAGPVLSQQQCPTTVLGGGGGVLEVDLPQLVNPEAKSESAQESRADVWSNLDEEERQGRAESSRRGLKPRRLGQKLPYQFALASSRWANDWDQRTADDAVLDGAKFLRPPDKGTARVEQPSRPICLQKPEETRAVKEFRNLVSMSLYLGLDLRQDRVIHRALESNSDFALVPPLRSLAIQFVDNVTPPAKEHFAGRLDVEQEERGGITPQIVDGLRIDGIAD
jgi:hypothetical protein